MSKLFYSARQDAGVISVEGPALPQQRIFCFCSQFPSSWDFTTSGCRRCSWLRDVLGQEFLPAPGLLMKSEIQARPRFPDTCLNRFHCSEAYPAFHHSPQPEGSAAQLGRINPPNSKPWEMWGWDQASRPPSSLGGQRPRCRATNSFNDSGACSQTSVLSFILLFIVTCKINNTLNWKLLNWFLLPAKGPGSPLGCDHCERPVKKLDVFLPLWSAPLLPIGCVHT